MKKCKSCQTEIDKKAKKCPHCQSDQRNWFGRHPIITGILGIVVLFMVIGAASGSGTSDTKVGKDTVSASANAQAEAKTAETVTAQQLVADFDKNKLAAEDTYKNKYVEFSGKVKNISEDVLGTPYLSLEPPEAEEYYFGTTLACYFDADKEAGKEAVKALENGETYTLRGIVDGMTLGIISIKKCEIVN